MYYVYLLRVQNANLKYYIGKTENVDRRLEEHIRGKVYTTYRLGNPKLIYFEAYLDSELASEREKQLKRFGSAYYALLKRLGLEKT